MDERVLILGGGPAGVGAAFALRKQQRGQVTVFERGAEVGGHAGSFWSGSQWLDHGSHALHRDCDPTVLDDLRGLLGDDLILRPRNARIRLRGRWLRHPPSGPDLLLHLDKAVALGAGLDLAGRAWARVARSLPEEESYADVLRARLGRTVCEHLHFPYARKRWGYPPEALSAEAARGQASTAGLLRRMARPPGTDTHWYPREGFGQLSRVLAQAAAESGADVRTETEVTCVRRSGAGWRVEARGPEGAFALEGRYLWSTLPLTTLVGLIQPIPADAVVQAAAAMEYRAMILCYLELPTERFHDAAAHYFPEDDVVMTRVSEPKNFFGHAAPRRSSTLCAEIPCAPDDELWRASDEDLAERVGGDLARTGLPLSVKPRRVFTRRMRAAYPIHRRGYQRPLAVLERWADTQPDLLCFGRQGSFRHDNTHHALAMAYAAAECLGRDGFDEGRWVGYRARFQQHTAED